MKGPPGQAPLPGAGEEEAVALFNNIFEAYIRANGPVDESKPPNVEVRGLLATSARPAQTCIGLTSVARQELLAWAEANPQLVYNAVGAGPEGQSDRERALASIGGASSTLNPRRSCCRADATISTVFAGRPAAILHYRCWSWCSFGRRWWTKGGTACSVGRAGC